MDTILIHWRYLSPSPLNTEVRGAAIDPTEIAELADSILQKGLIQPLNIIPLAPPSGSPLWGAGGAELGEAEVTYQILTGERRWRAAKSLGDRAPLLPCLINTDPGDEIDQLITMGIENLQRTNLGLLAEARYYRALQRRGLDERQIAQRTGKYLSRIRQCLGLFDFPEPIQAHFDAGRLPLSAASTLKKLPPELQLEIADKTTGRSKTEIDRVVGLVQAHHERQKKARQVNGQDRHHETLPPPPLVINHGDLKLAVRATCAACESYQLMTHDLKWENVSAGLNGTCDTCEVKGIKEACQLCPLVDFLRLLKQLHNGQGEPIGPPHLYRLGVLQ